MAGAATPAEEAEAEPLGGEMEAIQMASPVLAATDEAEEYESMGRDMDRSSGGGGRGVERGGGGV
jgi:hypothetical protein